MEKRELICICCPVGCSLMVQTDHGEVLGVNGNTCPRGDAYARKEVTDPTRIVTSIVPVDGGIIPMVPVKTAADIPKDKIDDCMKAIKGIRVSAPVEIGQVMVCNAAGTGVDVVATKRIEKSVVYRNEDWNGSK